MYVRVMASVMRDVPAVTTGIVKIYFVKYLPGLQVNSNLSGTLFNM